MTIDEALKDASTTLSAAGVSEPRREAASLLAFAIDKPASFLIAHPEFVLSKEQRKTFESVVARRGHREPFQYITGKQEFWGLEFAVAPGVLIPRPETEILVEAAIEHLANLSKPSFLELGAGSGCVSVSVLHSLPDSTAVATDISPTALNIAAKNARRHGVAGRLDLRHADSLIRIDGQFDLIVSNPPYIPNADIATLQSEVKDYEPREALRGGEDGLDVIRGLARDAGHILANGGVLMMEIGAGQAAAVADLFDPDKWGPPEFRNDLQAIPRVAIAERK